MNAKNVDCIYDQTLFRLISSTKTPRKLKKQLTHSPVKMGSKLIQQEQNEINVAGRLPENSLNRFVDRQSKKSQTDKKNLSFH